VEKQLVVELQVKNRYLYKNMVTANYPPRGRERKCCI
jgi:hypothetical protein